MNYLFTIDFGLLMEFPSNPFGDLSPQRDFHQDYLTLRTILA